MVIPPSKAQYVAVHGGTIPQVAPYNTYPKLNAINREHSIEPT